MRTLTGLLLIVLILHERRLVILLSMTLCLANVLIDWWVSVRRTHGGWRRW